MQTEAVYDLSSLLRSVEDFGNCTRFQGPIKKRARSLTCSDVAEDGCDGSMVHHVVVNGRPMAPHPYGRKYHSYRKRSVSGSGSSRKRSFEDQVKKEPLKGLVPEQGETCLPLEDIARIQMLVEPRFAWRENNEAFDHTPRPFQDHGFSESDRKQKILRYLRGDLDNISIKSEDCLEEFPMECSENGFDFGTPMQDNLFQVPGQVFFVNGTPIDDNESNATTDFENVAAGPSGGESPLSKLEEMKALLPAVEPGDTKPIIIVPSSPSSPASSVSSTSSKESEDEQKKKKYLPYKGIGQIELWQFIVDCLARGEHGVAWTNADLCEFKFTRPDVAARAWGNRKNNSNMTYEKMCRGLRGYYPNKKNLLRKVPNHRDVFQFVNENIKKLCKENVQECNAAKCHSQKTPRE